MKRKLDILLTIIFLAGVTYVSFFAGIPLKKANATEEVKKVIVVDAGHGGFPELQCQGHTIARPDSRHNSLCCLWPEVAVRSEH